MTLPPGRAKLSTKPAPTGSRTIANTIGTVRVACSNAAVPGWHGQDDVRRKRHQFRRVCARAVGIGRSPAVVDPHVAAVGPAQFLQPLQESREASLSFRIVGGPVLSTPTRRIRSACCACAASGQATPRRQEGDEFAPLHGLPQNMETKFYHFATGGE